LDTGATDANLIRKEIVFPNGNRAQAAAVSADTPAASILRVRGIKQPKALILIVGGSGNLDKALIPRLLQLFGRGIARAAGARAV
jgi:hypothetical protein